MLQLHRGASEEMCPLIQNQDIPAPTITGGNKKRKVTVTTLQDEIQKHSVPFIEAIQTEDAPVTVITDGIPSTTFWTEPSTLDVYEDARCNSDLIDSGFCGLNSFSEEELSDGNASYGSRMIMNASTPVSRTISSRVATLMDFSPVTLPRVFDSHMSELLLDTSVCSDCDTDMHDQSLLCESLMDKLQFYSSFDEHQMERSDLVGYNGRLKEPISTATADNKKLSCSRMKSLSCKLKRMRSFLSCGKGASNIKVLAHL